MLFDTELAGGVVDELLPTSGWCFSRLKRAVDLVGAGILGLVLWPVFGLAAAAVLLSSGWPVIYSQVRLGRHLRPFRVYKLRTMRLDAELVTGPVLALENDPRVTPVGRVLRRTRVDEIPQLLNVFRGEMSLVGPRPERPVFVKQFMREIPGYIGRYALLPGITGPAQVAESYHASAAEKLVHDLDYRERASLLYDFRVLLATVGVVVRANGR